MARSGINKVIIIGNLGSDPECTFMPNGSAVTKVSIATSESWKDKQSGQEQERTEWHRITGFNRLGEIMGEYLRKGSKVCIEGSLRTNKWQDKGGNDRYTTEIIANQMQMLDSKGDNQQHNQQQSQNDRATSQQLGGGVKVSAQQAAPQQQTPAQTADEFLNDIPFS